MSPELKTLTFTFDRLRSMVDEVERMAPDPKEFHVNPLTRVGRYSVRWKKIEEANMGPFGPIFPVTENDYVPEGIVLLLNKRPKNDPLVIITDLREVPPTA